MKRHRTKLPHVQLPPLPQLTLAEVTELEQVIRNGMLVSGELAAHGKLTQAGAVDALCRTVSYLRGKFQQPPKPAPAPTPPAPSSPPPAAGSKPE